jgi:enamine deaminase RidA (YjgF/YER057c/UK114 family)
MEDLAKLHTYYVYDGEGHAVTEYWERMTRARLNYLPNPGPAATALRVSGTPSKEILIAIDGIAVIGGDRQRIMPKQSWDWSIPTPFSQGWKIDNRIFVGGQISADIHGRATAVGDVETQTKNILEFVHQVLRGGGGDWPDLAALKICFRHSGSAGDSRALNSKILEVVRRTIPEPRPALTAFGIDLVYEGLLLEIDGYAILGGEKKIIQAEMEVGSVSADFAQAWKTDAEIYIGGVFARSEAGLQEQAEASLQKLALILDAADADYRDLVKITVFFVADRHGPAGPPERQILVDVLGRYLGAPGPVVTMVQVPLLPQDGQLFQIDGIAVTRKS